MDRFHQPAQRLEATMQIAHHEIPSHLVGGKVEHAPQHGPVTVGACDRPKSSTLQPAVPNGKRQAQTTLGGGRIMGH